MLALDGKVAIVTGASAGIGRAVAEELATAGARVVVTARRKEKLEELVREIGARGGKALAVTADAGKDGDTDVMLQRAAAWSGELGRGGRVDIVVVNAGRGLAGGLLNSDLAQWEELYKTNVMGAAYLMRRSAEIMVSQGAANSGVAGGERGGGGGDIVVLGSVVGKNISPYSGFYGSSKFAVMAMAEGLRRELCGKGVRVSTIEPGIVISEFQGVAGYTEENFGQVIKRYGKALEPADVARAVLFMVSQPAHVHINELMIRPAGQDYP